MVCYTVTLSTFSDTTVVVVELFRIGRLWAKAAKDLAIAPLPNHQNCKGTSK